MPEEPRDLEGRTVLVTGANTGIGRATARELARRGARVHVACRSYERARPVLDDIATAHGPDAVGFLALDLADLASVRAAAGAYIASGEPLHVLVDNAGVAGQRGTTADGFELAFGINHLGHFLFTTMLLGVLTRSAPARVVVVASDSHYGAKGIDFDALRRPTRSVTGMREYGVSKLCNVLFAQELGRRVGAGDADDAGDAGDADGTLPDTKEAGITTSALHPGVIASDIWRRLPWPLETLAKRFMKPTDEGARTPVYCATDPDVAAHSGRYYDEGAAHPPSERATPELGAELWERSEAWTTG
jgi:NAD(P)-dependent dehydrogenase (short-subunit alcohol dehydrogenase family)